MEGFCRGGVSKPETVITVKEKKVNKAPKGPMPYIAFTKNNIRYIYIYRLTNITWQ